MTWTDPEGFRLSVGSEDMIELLNSVGASGFENLRLTVHDPEGSGWSSAE